MAGRKSIVAHEGIFTLDTLARLLKRTLFSPKLSLPLFLLLEHTAIGRNQVDFLFGKYEDVKAVVMQAFAVIVALGIAGRINSMLNWGATNNWTTDVFVPEKEIVVITGGSSGIGAEIVKLLLGSEQRIKAVIVLDVQPLLFKSSASNLHYYSVDLSSTTAITKIASKIRAEIGDPTVLVNNAGICRGKTVLEASADDIALTFAVNVTAHFLLVKEFLPTMVERDHGHVVTVASIGAYFAAPQMVDYNASKAAAQSFHEGLTLELRFRYGTKKIRTTLVSQGYVKTPMFFGFKSDSKVILPALEPLTVAEAVVDKVLGCEGGQLVMPAVYNALTGIRGWTVWVQIMMRNMTHDVMASFKGKQVM